jgi:hypothetical protein
MTLDTSLRLFSGLVLTPASLAGVAIAQTGPHILFLILFVATVTFALRPHTPGDGGHDPVDGPPPRGAMAIHLDGPAVGTAGQTVEPSAPAPNPVARGRAAGTWPTGSRASRRAVNQ